VAGADVVFTKPVRIENLRKLFNLIEREGPYSKPGMAVREYTDRMEWVPRSKGQAVI
jgi:hypothetical protein